MIPSWAMPARSLAVVGLAAAVLAAGGVASAVTAEAAGSGAGRPAASAPVPPRNTGPEASARTRIRRGRHGTSRIIRRTPAVMREDAARVKRGDLFSTWSNTYLE